MAKLQLALCITDLDVGGAEKALVQLATRLDSDRFEPVVYCLGPRPEVDEASCVPPLEAAGIEVQCLGATGKRQLPSIVGRLRAVLTERPPDVLQCFLFHANMAGRLAARRAGVSHVVSGIRVAEPRRWHLWADRLTNGMVQRYVCVSESVARFSINKARLPENKVLVIPNGIDLDAYPAATPVDMQSLGIPVGRRVITYVGRLEPQKSVDWLIETAGGWLDRLADCDLLLVGKGPEHQKLIAQCQKRGLSDRVHLAGWRPDVPEILAASDMLVLPSRWEGMPNVVLEAMASRLPVLASDVEGVRELLGPNADEQTVDHGDSAAFTEKIVRIASDPALSSDLGDRNRQRVANKFGMDGVVRSYQELWESLVGT